MIPDRIEYLLMLARDERQENDDLIDKQNELFAARALRLLQLQELHEETGRILQEELKRFTRWMPQDNRGRSAPANATLQGQQQTPTQEQYEKMPRVVQQGPLSPFNNLQKKEK